MMETMKATETTPPREPLDRAAIVAAAMALADEHGVRALTMRKLAGSLGYEVMSLYNHVANKGEVLTLMVDAVGAEVGDPPPDAEPLQAVRALALATRAAFLRHPWAPELWQQHMPGPARIDGMENLLRTLARTGLSADLAHHGFHAVNNHVLGYTLQEMEMNLGHDPNDAQAEIKEFMAEVSPDTHPHTIAHVRQHLDGDTASSFELVLDLILDGLVHLHESSPASDG